MLARSLGMLVLLLSPCGALANPEVGDRLPTLAVQDCGELELAGDDVRYAPWDHAGAPLLLHFMAARAGLDDVNGDTVRHVLRVRPAIRPNTVTLLNTKDVFWGTGGLVKAIIEGRKREIPRARMVLDCEGHVGERWELPEQASVLMLLDAQGEVRFFQVGPTPAERFEELIAAVDSLGLPPPPEAGATLR